MLGPGFLGRAFTGPPILAHMSGYRRRGEGQPGTSTRTPLAHQHAALTGLRRVTNWTPPVICSQHPRTGWGGPASSCADARTGVPG